MPNITNTDSNNSSKSIDVTDDKLNILQHLSKITQTPEVIPEPDYKNPDYSPMANIGKTINEKITKNHDLQIGDVINCIGEFLKKNLGNNGWVLLEYPVQPLQMALLEYMLTGKIPCFGKELCNQNKKKSWIIPEYEDNNGIMYTSTNIYLSRCIKIIKRRDEIKNDKWNNFLQFYKQQDSIKVLISYLNDNIKDSRKAADILVGLILNEENYVFKTNKIFKLINIMIDNDDDNTSIQSDKDTDDKHNSERSLIITDENIDTIQTDQITNQFQLLNPSLSWIEGPLADSMYKALYLQNMWETMETSYIHKIKELLNSKKKLFEDLKLKKNVILKTVNEEIPISNNPSLLILLKNYENEKKKKEITKKLEHKKLLLQLQFDMWDQVDNDFEQIIQSVSHKVNDQWVVIQKNTLISIYEQLLEIELNRAITTLNFLRRYYDDNNTYHIVDFDVFTDFPKGIIDTNNKFKIFQIYCLDRINQFKNYVNENYEKTIIMINKNIWTQCVITEKNRFIDQVHRIKSGIILDETYLNDLIRIDNDLERIRTLYEIKINDVNHLFKIMECAIDAEQNINGLINQISGQFYINECSVLEIYCKQIFYSKENFNIKQLTTMVNTLLEIAPRYKIAISDLIDTLSKLCKIHNIYPINWPIDDQFYNHFPKEILGDNITTIDWRDFVVQCMELPYPNIEEILSYRKLFQVYDVGDENITVESYETTKLWFENKSIRYDEAKWLLYDMYQDQNKLNYSAMLLAFCRDEQPCRGLLKAFGLIFDWIPYNLKTLSQHRLNDEKREIHSEDDVNSELSSNLSNEELTFDQNLMTSFLLSVLDLYINDKRMLGNIDIFQLVKSIFENVQPKQERETMIIDLFQNNEMNDLYGTVYKFQIRELAEVAKNIVMKYDLNI
ncbi:Hypothetical protein CINCED_3A022079 [Cinara cedri]|uniref:SPEF2 C-terminal domain-containing protein n=1 Tax=Cinara cedri TaxID=506608 RepID=A0A5E4N3Q2_9HEMI|nr:Hypothetical protein CINCED_3A022079 [Cinara cedri]